MGSQGLRMTGETTLPASWYRSQHIFELERRAIFSKMWMCVTHESRFPEVGSYASYEAAGYGFFIVRDRKKELKAFLNTCRHRAYPILEKESGKASILACKYHGWSYGLSGNLAKAPRFDTVEGFDKTEYPLFSVHLHIDKLGWMWVNLDSASTPTVSWEEYFKGVDQQARISWFNMDKFEYDHTWEMTGDYNWKNIIDNYNECYHCSTAHPGILATTILETYDVKGEKGWIEHHSEPLKSVDHKFGVAPTYMFPNASVTISDDYTYLMRVNPLTPTTVKMQYEVYRRKGLDDEAFKEIDVFFKQIENEDKGLSNGAQRSLNNDTYVAGPLHPYNEKGVIYFKGLVKKTLHQHRDAEVKLGRKISPSQRSMSTKDLDEEEKFCQSLCEQDAKTDVEDWGQ